MEMTIIEKLRDAYRQGIAKPIPIPGPVKEKLHEAARQGLSFADLGDISRTVIKGLKNCGFQVGEYAESGEQGCLVRGWEEIEPEDTTGLLRQCVGMYKDAWAFAGEASERLFAGVIFDCEQAAHKGLKSCTVQLETHRDNWGKYHLLPASQFLLERLEKVEGLKVKNRGNMVQLSGWAA